MAKDEELIERAARYVLDNSRKGKWRDTANDYQCAADDAKLMEAYRDIISKTLTFLAADRLEALARPVVGVEGLSMLSAMLDTDIAREGPMASFMIRAGLLREILDCLSALAASPSPVVGDREAIGRAYRNCAEMNRQMAGTIGAQPGSSIFAALEACAERMDEIATDNADPHTTDRAGMAQEVE